MSESARRQRTWAADRPIRRHPRKAGGTANPAERARQSSIGPVTDSAVAEEARRLTEGAIDALPEGRLAEQLALGRELRVKLGIDPTAPDIHLGHVVVLARLRAFQDAGHRVVLIVGDYTARVGDPSGRSAERPVLSDAEIDANARTFSEQAFKVLDPERTEVRRNSEWLSMPSDELFGLIRRFTVARLLEREEFGASDEGGGADLGAGAALSRAPGIRLGGGRGRRGGRRQRSEVQPAARPRRPGALTGNPPSRS